MKNTKNYNFKNFSPKAIILNIAAYLIWAALTGTIVCKLVSINTKENCVKQEYKITHRGSGRIDTGKDVV